MIWSLIQNLLQFTRISWVSYWLHEVITAKLWWPLFLTTELDIFLMILGYSSLPLNIIKIIVRWTLLKVGNFILQHFIWSWMSKDPRWLVIRFRNSGTHEVLVARINFIFVNSSIRVQTFSAALIWQPITIARLGWSLGITCKVNLD